MRWAWVAFGLGVMAFGVSDLARTLFHPSEHGNVSDHLGLLIWRVLRRSSRTISAAGPTAFIAIIVYWGSSVVLGFAFINRAFMPGAFLVSSGMDPTRLQAHPFWSSLNLSLASLITVTLGIQTNSGLLQFAMGVEAILGFVILTASISWLLSIYPVIEHRRSLAHEVTLLHFSETKGIRNVEEMESSDLQTLLVALAEQLITVRTELSQFPITYFFHENDDRSSLLPALQFLAELSRDASESRPAVVIGTVALGGAIDDLLELMTTKYLERTFPDRWAALAALQADHRRGALHHCSPNRQDQRIA